MNKEKRKILIILLIIFAIIFLILLLINSKNRNKQPEVKPPVNVVEDRKERINNYQEFFSIQATINENVDMNSSYTAKEIYINGNEDNNYYFIHAKEFIDMKYNSDVYLLLILDNNSNNYVLTTINESITDLENYAKNYSIQPKNINNGNKLLSASSSVESVLTIYVDYFKKMLASNNLEAYNMLAEDTKAQYLNYEDFNNKAFDIYNQLTSKIFSYSEGEKSEDGITYYLEDDNRNKIIIYEESIMNFKISY